jgi:hypothetical protein
VVGDTASKGRRPASLKRMTCLVASGFIAASYRSGKSLSLIKREVGVKRTPRGFRQTARSISFLSPIARWPVAFLAIKIASFICDPKADFLILPPSKGGAVPIST